jgi:hypothetical protein
MPYTNAELQRRYRKKMHKAGFKREELWVKLKTTRPAAKMTQEGFIKNFKKLTAGWDKESLPQLYDLLIKIIKGKKEADRQKRK